MPEPYRTRTLTINEAMASSLGSAAIVRRIEEPGLRPRLLADRSGGPLRRSTYRAPVAQRLLLLGASFALAATGALQAFGLATLL